MSPPPLNYSTAHFYCRPRSPNPAEGAVASKCSPQSLPLRRSLLREGGEGQGGGPDSNHTSLSPLVPLSTHSANSHHRCRLVFPNLTLFCGAFCEGSRAPDLPTLNPRSFISAMNHPILMLLCYCFQIPWQHICKPGPLQSFLPATHSLFLLSPVPTSPDESHSTQLTLPQSVAEQRTNCFI